MSSRQQMQMTRIGLYGVSPFVISAVALWLSPLLLPQYIALDFHHLALVYGGVIAAWSAGVGVGARLFPKQRQRPDFLPGMLLALAAFIAILPSGVFFMALGAAWRHAIVLLVLIYALMRDIGAAEAGILPKWYANLRMRLTFWAGLSIFLIIVRLVSWGYY